MKHTIKLSKQKAVTVKPGPNGGMWLEVTVAGVVLLSEALEVNTAAVLAFGIEQALEASRIAQERAASAFNAPDTETPFPALGGDAAQCPPCHGDCRQGRDCPASADAAKAQRFQGVTLRQLMTAAGVAA